MPRFEVSWLIPVEADSPEHAAALAWCAVRERTSCPVSIVQPMVDDLLRAGSPVIVDALPGGCWLPGYSLRELELLQAGQANPILKPKGTR